MTEVQESFKMAEFDCKIPITIATHSVLSTILVQFLLQTIWSLLFMLICFHVFMRKVTYMYISFPHVNLELLYK
jgi:hypothetical protein